MSKNETPTKVIVSCRFSYLHCWEPEAINGGEPKYSVSAIIPKSDKETIKKIQAAVEAAKQESLSKWGGKIPPNLKLPLRDGDIDRPEDEAYKGCYFFNANSRQAPQVVDKQVQPILDQTEVYSGCYGRISVNFYGYNTREDDSLKRKGIWKRGVVVSGIMLAMNLSGCSFFVKKDSGNTDIQSVRQESENADKTVMKRSKSEEKEAEEILEICSKTYAKAEKEGKLDDLEMIRDLIKELGEKGFTAVDSENQVNMTEYEKLIQFSEKAEAKKNGRMTVVEVAKGGSCIIRNMETHDGIVNMIRSYCIYENGKLKQSSEDIYRTESWEYTEDGHLMFSGRLAFEGSYEVTRNEIMEYMAYRVLSLDETCRELNRKYILPIGYERNNMFLTDWSEEEFAELDFYDMFDLFYQENHTANGEFTFGNAMGTSAVYLISKEKFEPVIKSKFKISSEVLQSKTVYYPCEEVYEYKPRGLEETEYPEYPYPEVIGYVNNDDGTLTLKVQAVFPYRGVSKAYIHEVTVRDTKDGGIQYVGNRIIEPINNPEIRWHVPRLTRTEWEELYGDN